jgi:hypothetical protein
MRRLETKVEPLYRDVGRTWHHSEELSRSRIGGSRRPLPSSADECHQELGFANVASPSRLRDPIVARKKLDICQVVVRDLEFIILRRSRGSSAIPDHDGLGLRLQSSYKCKVRSIEMQLMSHRRISLYQVQNVFTKGPSLYSPIS